MRNLADVIERMKQHIDLPELTKIQARSIYVPPEYMTLQWRQVSAILLEKFPDPMALTDAELSAIQIFVNENLTREQLVERVHGQG